MNFYKYPTARNTVSKPRNLWDKVVFLINSCAYIINERTNDKVYESFGNFNFFIELRWSIQ